VNTGDPAPGPLRAGRRVLEIQAKLHRWANDEPQRRFDDLFGLVTDPGFLRVVWERVAGNKGARSAGVDGMTAGFVRERIGVENFLAGLREQLKSRSFRPLPVRERMIPKPGSRKRRRLGIPGDRGPGSPGVLEAGAGADFRGGVQAVLVWFQAQPARARRDGRDALPGIQDL
jgi:RNA-directed DNA polymerase